LPPACAELTTPAGDLWSSDTYNKLFTMHGIMMVFFVLIPAVPPSSATSSCR
jgi:cytochrome c oxidase subunit 1